MSGLLSARTILQTSLKVDADGQPERAPVHFRCGLCGREWTEHVEPWLTRGYEPGVNVDACDECAAKQPPVDSVFSARMKRDREDREKRAADIIVRRCGQKYAATSFSAFVAKTESQIVAFQAAEDFAWDHTSSSLYLYGSTGCGKTHLAVSIYRVLLENADRDIASFWPMPDLLMHIRREMTSDCGSEDEAIRRLVQVPVLILDDLGTEKLTDWARQVVYTVVAGRDRDNRPMVITSNLALGQIGDHIGDRRVTSRIAGSARIIHVQGEDYRIASRRRK